MVTAGVWRHAGLKTEKLDPEAWQTPDLKKHFITVCTCGSECVLWAWIWSRARWQQPLRTWPPQLTLLMHLMVIIDRRNGGEGRENTSETGRNRGAVRGSVTWAEVHVSLQKHSNSNVLLREVTDILRYVNMTGNAYWLDCSGLHTLSTRLSRAGTKKAHTGDRRILNVPPWLSWYWKNSWSIHWGRSFPFRLWVFNRRLSSDLMSNYKE